jgi:hypothetical protein
LRLLLPLLLRGRGPWAGWPAGRGGAPGEVVPAAEDAPVDADPDPDADAEDAEGWADPPGWRSSTAVEPPPLPPLPEPGRIGPLRFELVFFAAAPPRLAWPEAATLMAVLRLAASTAE